MTQTHFVLLRHGEPEDKHCLLGRTDSPLTPKGRQACFRAIAGQNFDLVVTSPLSRCHSFAAEYANQNQLPLKQNEEVIELDFGRWDGCELSTLWSLPGNPFGEFWQQPFERTPPEGEATQAMIARASNALLSLAHIYPEQRILIVTHSGVLRGLLHWLLGGQAQGNAHLSRVELGYAAQLHLSVYQDGDDRLWPQLTAMLPSPVLEHHPLNQTRTETGA